MWRSMLRHYRALRGSLRTRGRAAFKVRAGRRWGEGCGRDAGVAGWIPLGTMNRAPTQAPEKADASRKETREGAEERTGLKTRRYKGRWLRVVRAGAACCATTGRRS